jgi:hypothetical protein
VKEAQALLADHRSTAARLMTLVREINEGIGFDRDSKYAFLYPNVDCCPKAGWSSCGALLIIKHLR